MSEPVQVEFGGKVDSSYDSSAEHVRAGLRETAKEYGKFAAEVATSAATAAAVHEAKASVIRAAWNVVTVAAQRGLATIVAYAPQVAGGLSLITGGVTILRGAMSLLDRASGEVQTGLGKFAAQEDLVSKLKPLTGSVDAAKAKLKELADVAKGTKLELPEVVDTFRSTHVQTGGALSDKKGLTMIGDVATASGNGLKDTGDAIGKLYGDLQAGAAINEATDKLKDMGIVSAEVTQHIYELQYAGKSGAEIWAYLAGQLQKSSGAMQAASDNLTTLQKALADAKNRLHELFAEASAGGKTATGEDDGIKGEIKDQIAELDALQPAVQEAGGLYAQLRSVLSDTVKYWTGNTQAAGANTDAVKKNGDSILNHIGNLRRWVDALGVAYVALYPIGATLIAGGGALAFFGTAAAVTVGVLGGIATVAVAAAAGLSIYIDHATAADKRLAALIQSNNALIEGLKDQEAGIKSVTDKILALAKAYDVLHTAQEQRRHAKTDAERETADNLVKRAQLRVQSIENKDDDKLTAGEARSKSEQATKDAKDTTGDLLTDPAQKYDAALSDMEEARKKQYELREKLAAAQRAAGAGGESSDAVVDPQIAAARKRIDESRRRERANREQATLLELQGSGAGAPALELAEKEKGSQATDRQKIADLDGARRGREQRIESARTDLAAQDTVVATVGTNLVKTQRAAEDYESKQRELAITKQIAELESEGLTRARAEHDIKVAGLKADLTVAEQSPDKTKAADISAKIAQADAELRKQEEAAADRKGELEDEQKIAALKTEGLQRTRDEWAIKRAGLETQLALARSKGDETKASEIQTKIAQGNAGVQKDERKSADSEREIEAEAKIADLQSEGIQRAREESDIRLGLIEARWQEANAAKDTLASDKARLDYTKEQAAQRKRDLEDAIATANDQRALDDEIAKGRDAAQGHELDRQLKLGQITTGQHRDGKAALVEKERLRLEADADAKNKEADDAEKRGDKDKALKLRKEAEGLSSQAVEKGYEENDLLNPTKAARPVTDSLARLALGGNVGPSADAVSKEARETNRLLKDIHTAITDGGKDPRRPDDKAARFSR